MSSELDLKPDVTKVTRVRVPSDVRAELRHKLGGGDKGDRYRELNLQVAGNPVLPGYSITPLKGQTAGVLRIFSRIRHCG